VRCGEQPVKEASDCKTSEEPGGPTIRRPYEAEAVHHPVRRDDDQDGEHSQGPERRLSLEQSGEDPPWRPEEEEEHDGSKKGPRGPRALHGDLAAEEHQSAHQVIPIRFLPLGCPAAFMGSMKKIPAE